MAETKRPRMARQYFAIQRYLVPATVLLTKWSQQMSQTNSTFSFSTRVWSFPTLHLVKARTVGLEACLWFAKGLHGFRDCHRCEDTIPPTSHSPTTRVKLRGGLESSPLNGPATWTFCPFAMHASTNVEYVLTLPRHKNKLPHLAPRIQSFNTSGTEGLKH